MSMSETKPKTEAEHKADFDLRDKDGTGEITVDEFKQYFLDHWSEVLDDVLLNAMLAQMDSSKDKKVSWPEYIKCMRNNGLVKE